MSQEKKVNSRNEDDDYSFKVNDNFYYNTYNANLNSALNQINQSTINSTEGLKTIPNISNLYNPKKEKVIVITNVNESLVEKMNKNSFELASQKFKGNHRLKFLNTTKESKKTNNNFNLNSKEKGDFLKSVGIDLQKMAEMKRL